MITCPWCKKSIDSKYMHKQCPMCKNDIDYAISIAVHSHFRYFRKQGTLERLNVLVWNGETEEAVNEIRRVLGREEPLIEPAFIAEILKSKPTDWNHTDAPEAIPMPPKPNVQQEPPKPTLTTCSACGHQIATKAESCPSCGNPTGVHVCPKCQSINTKVISGASKAGSILLWGVFAANKVVSKFECKDCGHKW